MQPRPSSEQEGRFTSITARSICTAIRRSSISAIANPVAFGVDDQERAEKAIKAATGKRLTYRWPDKYAKAT